MEANLLTNNRLQWQRYQGPSLHSHCIKRGGAGCLLFIERARNENSQFLLQAMVKVVLMIASLANNQVGLKLMKSSKSNRSRQAAGAKRCKYGINAIGGLAQHHTQMFKV